MPKPYFDAFSDRPPPTFPVLSPRRRIAWHLSAGAAAGLTLAYLNWRWTQSLNPDALFFSVLVAMVETLFAIGTLLFFFDIWDEGDTEWLPPPENRATAGLDPDGDSYSVDIFITVYDEDIDTVAPTIQDACAVELPQHNVTCTVHLLDDGNRSDFARLADQFGVKYHTRDNNHGFKAGNLYNGLFHSDGDFIVICDADTRLFSTFLSHTLGYFRDPDVAWVQTPHWFYDIPSGKPLIDLLTNRFPNIPDLWARAARHALPPLTIGNDVYLSDPAIFFDVIQRRRNRNGASFCCGAASIHRREALFQSALYQKHRASMRQTQKLDIPAYSTNLLRPQMEPFRFHVSEDLYTSIEMHSNPDRAWRSVYHPRVEAKMLSPQSIKAFATQRLKYAGGSMDLMLHDNPLWRRHMQWQVKTHYAATFFAYFSVVWTPILLFAPAFSLMTGQAPVVAYSLEFFSYFLPMLAMHEVAILLACKGHSLTNGRFLSVATLPLQWRAFAQVLRGEQPKFPPTPKTLAEGPGLHYMKSNLWLAATLLIAAIIGLGQWAADVEGFSSSFLLINLFWLSWNVALLIAVPLSVFLATPTNMNNGQPQTATKLAKVK